MAYDTGPALPPCNLAAESALIGGILFNNESFWQVCETVQADDFYAPAHKWLWRRMSMMIEAGQAADGVTLGPAASKSDKLKELGGAKYLFDLLDTAAFGPELRDYAKIISEMAARRAVLEAATALYGLAASPVADEPVSAVLAQGRALLDGVEDRHLPANGSVADLADETFEENVSDMLMPTGLVSLDKELGGMEHGQLTLAGARPGIGKTAFGICASVHAAEQGISVGFLQGDMTGLVTRQRLAWYIAHRAGDDLPFFSEMRRPGSPWITPEFRQRMAGHLKGDIGRRVMMSDKSGLTTRHIRYQIRKWKREALRRGQPPLGLIVIDHMGKVSPAQAYRGLYEKTSYASNELLDIAKDNPDLVFLVLVQLNRANSHEGRRPSLSDLRDSGKLEEDASAVILLHREDHYLGAIATNKALPEAERKKAEDQMMVCRGHMEAIVAKNRAGPPATVNLRHTIGKNIIRDATREEPNQETML